MRAWGNLGGIAGRRPRLRPRRGARSAGGGGGAVLGPYASVRQFGAYSGTPTVASPTPVDAIRAVVGDRIVVKTAEWGNAEATLAAAETSDIVIVVLGLNSTIENEGIDRTTLDL